MRRKAEIASSHHGHEEVSVGTSTAQFWPAVQIRFTVFILLLFRRIAAIWPFCGWSIFYFRDSSNSLPGKSLGYSPVYLTPATRTFLLHWKPTELYIAWAAPVIVNSRCRNGSGNSFIVFERRLRTYLFRFLDNDLSRLVKIMKIATAFVRVSNMLIHEHCRSPCRGVYLFNLTCYRRRSHFQKHCLGPYACSTVNCTVSRLIVRGCNKVCRFLSSVVRSRPCIFVALWCSCSLWQTLFSFRNAALFFAPFAPACRNLLRNVVYHWFSREYNIQLSACSIITLYGSGYAKAVASWTIFYKITKSTRANNRISSVYWWNLEAHNDNGIGTGSVILLIRLSISVSYSSSGGCTVRRIQWFNNNKEPCLSAQSNPVTECYICLIRG